MKSNMGILDRSIRAVIGFSIIGVSIHFQSWWGLLGVIPLTSSILAWCPVYAPFGISSCKMKHSN